jgi:hypothetical protein
MWWIIRRAPRKQCLFAVTPRVIKELKIAGISEFASEDYIQKAEGFYRSHYDPARKFICPARGITNAIGFAELFPEHLSLWLYNRKLLTDEMVMNHLERIPVLLPNDQSPHPEISGTVRPIFDFPTSHEFLATFASNQFFGYHRVCAWNAFVLQAPELAGMRTSDMDSDFSKNQRERR